MAEELTRWERLEEYIDDNNLDGGVFSQAEYAQAQGFTGPEATADIRSYLQAQRAKDSRTLFVLHRVPGTRTSMARWAVGVKTKDARLLGKSFHDDVLRRALRAFEPDLLRLAAINPRAARLVRAQITATIDHAIQLLALAAEGIGGGEESE